VRSTGALRDGSRELRQQVHDTPDVAHDGNGHCGSGIDMQLTIQQAAELLQTSEAMVRRWIRDGGLPAVLFNEQYRLNRVDLLVWAQENQVSVQPQVLAPHLPGTVSLRAALARGGIHRDLDGRTSGEVLRDLFARLELPPEVDGELLREMVVARQAQSSTAVGHGVAIPHARYPLVCGVVEPLLGLGFPKTAVDFGAPDGEPVTALFLLLAPTIRAHLHLLARLARALGAELQGPIAARAADAVILAAAAAGDATAERAGARSAQP
jgi:PTS system nitrogen regulatory IIA component